ncbi:MAG: hypothetical protein ABIL45_03450 [candidate division WOR-3 bacterium]
MMILLIKKGKYINVYRVKEKVKENSWKLSKEYPPTNAKNLNWKWGVNAHYIQDNINKDEFINQLKEYYSKVAEKVVFIDLDN